MEYCAAQIVTVVEFLVRMCRLVEDQWKQTEEKWKPKIQFMIGDISELLGKDGLFSRWGLLNKLV